ncbi:MAG TPA: hypothetical protein VMZ91_06555 [Candidatus Paceibacterota bacterium]|nr:hypothetical protein [Candidatus Paceibacterota bacterium]
MGIKRKSVKCKENGKIKDKRRKRYRSLKSIEDVYAHINKIQFSDGKQMLFSINDPDVFQIAENLFKDAEIPFDFFMDKGRRVYSVTYQRPKEMKNMVLEELDDELEDDIIF